MPLLVEKIEEDPAWQQASLPSYSIIKKWIWGFQLLRNFDNSWIRSLYGGWRLGVMGKKTLIDPKNGWKLKPPVLRRRAGGTVSHYRTALERRNTPLEKETQSKL